MSRAAFACLLAGGCCIAFAPIFVRLSDTGPLASAFWRVALAAPLLWIWVLHSSPRAPPSSPSELQSPSSPRAPPSSPSELQSPSSPRAPPSSPSELQSPSSPRAPQSRRWPGAQSAPVFLAGLFFAVDLGVWHWSIVWTSVANATLLANLAPIVVTLAGWLLWKQRVTSTFLVGMFVAIAGMFVLVGPNFAIGGTRLLGDALGALTAVFYASYQLAIKRARDAQAATAPLMAWSTTISAILLLPAALLSPQPMLPQDASGWLVLLGLAIVSQVLGQGLIAYAMAHLTASLSSVSLLIQPVVAALAAWAIFAEAVGPVQLVGGAIVLAGIWMAKRAS